MVLWAQEMTTEAMSKAVTVHIYDNRVNSLFHLLERNVEDNNPDAASLKKREIGLIVAQ